MFSRGILQRVTSNELKSVITKRSLTSTTLRTTPKFNSKSKLITQFNQEQKRGYAWSNKRDEGPKARYFFLIGIVGTAIFALVVSKVDAQDPAKSLAKKKNSMSEEEWEQQLINLGRKTLAFKPTEAEFYFVPNGCNNDKKVKQLVEKLEAGNDNSVGTIDLNELIDEQFNSENGSKYGALLKSTLDSTDLKSNGCHYKFSYKLAPGIFTKLVYNKVVSLRKEHPEYTRFVLLNYPNTIQEAVKFEQDVAVSKKLVLLGTEEKDNDIVEYFNTVDKVIKLEQLQVEKFERAVASTPVSSAAGPTSDKEQPPADDAPAIKKAQYKLRELGEPIRRYGETDQDVIDRLTEMLKKN
ncbi:unnamed protein product [Ambrosiozyma monospora]|uniref:Unnamed protein product n=1 Tax=Ambrosiozyma monospora TaxID=43982 RepID=A0ACB5SUL5_AMBMO|nr:unnamed protein product [Ambrosiozyma monospora]